MQNQYSLTEEQKSIIESREMVKKVIACAGSGKTSVLTSAVIDAIEKEEASPGEILCLTFTNNAAENMRERIGRYLSGLINIDSLNIYTFNSFGNLIIRENSYALGYGRDFRLINEVQSWNIIYEIFKDFSFKNIKAGKNIALFINDLLEYIWDLKNNLLSPDNIEDYLKNFSEYISDYKSRGLQKQEEEKLIFVQELNRIYSLYEKIKKQNNYIDYSDQILLPYILLKNSSVIRKKYSARFKRIFVDEFQDTNNAQAYLLSMLLDNKSESRLMVVGDDDQGIYGFRGACIDNIRNFDYFESDEAKNAKTYYLTVNFRSGKKIIDFTNNIIKQNKNREEKTVRPENDEKKSKVAFLKTDSLKEEASEITRLISELIHSGLKPKEIVILCRKKRFSEIEKALEEKKIRFETIGSKNFFFEPEILFMVSWLKIIAGISDEISILYILKSDKFKISDKDIFFLRNHSYTSNDNPKEKKSFFDSIRSAQNNEYISSEGKKRLKNFINELGFYVKSSYLINLGALTNLIFYNSGLYNELCSRFGPSAKKKIKNIENLVRTASDFELNNLESGIEGFSLYLKDLAKTDYDESDISGVSAENSVKIMSIHAAKGLEFEAVFIPMLWDSDYTPKMRSKEKEYLNIPSPLRKDGRLWNLKKDFTSVKAFESALREYYREEERRIFYVGASRAKKLLVMSYPEFEDESIDPENKNKSKKILKFVEEDFKNTVPELILNKKTKDYIEENFQVKNLKDSEKTEFYDDYAVFAENLDFLFQKRNPTFNKNSDNRARGRANFNYNEAELFLYEKLKNYSKEKSKSEPHGSDFIKSTDSNKNIYSLSHILDYLKCPRLYMFKHGANITEPPSADAQFGTEVHNFLQRFTSLIYHDFLAGGSLSRSFKNIINPKEMHKSSEKSQRLKKYIINMQQSGFFAFEGLSSVLLEYLFYWKIKNAYITCKTDRIDLSSSGETIIYDFKTSALSGFADKTTYKNQLNSYICAYSDLTGFDVKHLIGKIYFLEDAAITESRICSEKEKNEFTEKLEEAVSKIKGSDFKAKPSKHCQKQCRYFNLCRDKFKN